MVSKVKETDAIAIDNKYGKQTNVTIVYRKQIQREIDKANKRYRALLKNPQMEGVPALQKARKIIGDSNKFSISGMDNVDALAYLAQVKGFLDDVSSTVTGYRKYLKNKLDRQGYTKAEIKQVGNNIKNLAKAAEKTNGALSDILQRIYKELGGEIYHLPDFYNSVAEQVNEYRKEININASELDKYSDEIVDYAVKRLSYDDYIQNQTDDDDIDILYERWGNDILKLD